VLLSRSKSITTLRPPRSETYASPRAVSGEQPSASVRNRPGKTRTRGSRRPRRRWTRTAGQDAQPRSPSGYAASTVRWRCRCHAGERAAADIQENGGSSLQLTRGAVSAFLRDLASRQSSDEVEVDHPARRRSSSCTTGRTPSLARRKDTRPARASPMKTWSVRPTMSAPCPRQTTDTGGPVATPWERTRIAGTKPARRGCESGPPSRRRIPARTPRG